MPDWIHVLEGHDLKFLESVARAWAVDLHAPDARQARQELLRQIAQPAAIQEIIELLPHEAYEALLALLVDEGKMPWSVFVRRFGELRIMGPARRERERPEMSPISVTEVLWYRALIGRAFLDIPPEPQEYAYIPEDLIPFLGFVGSQEKQPPGREASPVECAVPVLAHDGILDDICTFLAARRLNMPVEKWVSRHVYWRTAIPPAILLPFAVAAGLMDETDQPLPEAVRSFLEAPRATALSRLVGSWLNSSQFNELRQIPGLIFEGDWMNNAKRTRQAVIELVSLVPQQQWWSVSAFIDGIHELYPDFQRVAGDYDAWFIRRTESAEYFRGFGAWNDVEGALLRYLLAGPLYWLGVVDLAYTSEEQYQSSPNSPSAFRISAWGAALLQGHTPEGLPEEDEKILVNSAGKVAVPCLAPRAVRYQIARFGRWEGARGKDQPVYWYGLTPASLEQAQKQGVKIGQLVNLLQRVADGQIPPLLLQALRRWETGTQVRLQKVTLLQVSSPDILAALRKHRAGQFIGEALTPVIAPVRAGREAAVVEALAELGYLADASLGDE